MIDSDEFTVWRDHPITQAFFDRIAAEIDRTKQNWDQVAWQGGDLSERTYATHKERVDTLEFMRSLGFDELFKEDK